MLHRRGRRVQGEKHMTQFYYEKDADPAAIAGQSVAVVGYGNQGRPWALNLRDSGLNPRVCVRNDDTRAQAEEDGFATGDIGDAQQADIVCILVPDDVIPQLGLARADHQLTIVASGYSFAFKRFSPAGDQAMIAPRIDRQLQVPQIHGGNSLFQRHAIPLGNAG